MSREPHRGQYLSSVLFDWIFIVLLIPQSLIITTILHSPTANATVQIRIAYHSLILQFQRLLE
ncbi:MAG: hypothetical protein EAZ98_01230 [Oscillatoriales cyanobacterium]|nr:MAG: hypothetical protein EAZ96_23600 [Oscillatoriales cyanobacterium]TAE02666.1 MAG: hypothetical protein EAZ98_01230 [Oscillatoriales cyanobacterium]